MNAYPKKPTPWRCARCSGPVELRHAIKHYAECQQRTHHEDERVSVAVDTPGGEHR